MFYDKFKQLCDQKGVSCTKAAVEMGLSNATPTKWKKTGATPDVATLAKVADYFGVSIGYLLGQEHPTIIDVFAGRAGISQVFSSEEKEKAPTPVSESGRSMNTITIAGRDGSYVKKTLTDEQVSAWKTLLATLPDADDL